MNVMTPEQLDAQSAIKIDKWVDLESEDAKLMDDNRDLTKKMLRIGFEEGVMITDSDGRVWGHDPKGGPWFPFHFEYGS